MNKMHSYIFLDLDDTLFQTRRKCLHSASDTLQVGAYLPDGSANSFLTRKQQWVWQYLQQGFRLVAVTARDYLAFQRVQLPFKEEVVLNHGAVILTPQGELDQTWHQHIMADLADYHQHLLALWSEIALYCQYDSDFKLRLVTDFDVLWYGVLKHRSGSEEPLRTVLNAVIQTHQSVLEGALYWHINGNNLAILPQSIRKEHAVQYLLTRYQQQNQPLITFAMADSFTDAPFLALCDYAIIPKNTQLASLLSS